MRPCSSLPLGLDLQSLRLNLARFAYLRTYRYESLVLGMKYAAGGITDRGDLLLLLSTFMVRNSFSRLSFFFLRFCPFLPHPADCITQKSPVLSFVLQHHGAEAVQGGQQDRAEAPVHMRLPKVCSNITNGQ